jgi:hypothetical protein
MITVATDLFSTHVLSHLFARGMAFSAERYSFWASSEIAA